MHEFGEYKEFEFVTRTISGICVFIMEYKQHQIVMEIAKNKLKFYIIKHESDTSCHELPESFDTLQDAKDFIK